MKKEIIEVVDDLKTHKKVAAVILFGSHAKKTSKPLSDIDIAVISKNPDKKIESEVAGLCSSKMDVVNFHRLPLYIQFEVLKHGKVLFVRNEKFLKEVTYYTIRDYIEMSGMYKRFTERIMSC